MNVLGFDLSSRKLAMVGVGERLTADVWEANKAINAKDRGAILRDFLVDINRYFTSLTAPFTVFIEQPLVGRGGAHATIVQAQVQGVVLASAIRCGAAGAYTVNVSSWKKAVVGNGAATKPDVAAWLGLHHPLLAGLAGDDQDLVDAACVALYGDGVLARARIF